MSRQVSELETLLQQLIDEHVKLLAHTEKQQGAMKAFDLKAMDDVVRLQEASRMRIATLETKRRILKQAVDENWLLIFEHDATVPWGRVQHDGKTYLLVAESKT